jgi:hypothetical protein
MAFDLGGAINNFTDYIINETFFSGLIKNPIGSAILIVIIIFIILSINYKEIITGPDSYKTAFYMFAFITAFLFIHYSAVKSCLSVTSSDKDKIEMFANIDQMRDVVEEHENDILALDSSVEQYLEPK